MCVCVCRSESALRNLSALMQLGNSAEVRNYISLLTGTLNRLSSDAGRNARAQRHARNTLICTMCQLESGEKVGRKTAKYSNLFPVGELHNMSPHPTGINGGQHLHSQKPFKSCKSSKCLRCLYRGFKKRQKIWHLEKRERIDQETERDISPQAS